MVVNALSRQTDTDHTTSMFSILSIPHPKFLDDLKRELASSEEFNDLKTRVTKDPQQHPAFILRDGLLLYKGRIWINRGNNFIALLLEEFHKSPLGGHMGLAKTLSQLKQSFYWEGMRQDMQQFIKQCVDCLQTKYIPQKSVGLLHRRDYDRIWLWISLSAFPILRESQLS
ncbi:uncharacterized protein [Glycine max]|uniref:uncharacterized protein n=1 Tax=Glycine max TaxID=3847 RepID=UPI0003DE8EB5|nr:uncharacterized protein LOC102670335 [Glycine max]|eukprot:XP_006582627.1 uncharacterized protein LOC102670335 [Glycine max]